jgi:hypothetical protein
MGYSKGRNALWVSCIFYAMLLIVGWIAFVTRFDRAEWGFPYLYYWDEPQTASTALRMLKTGNFNPYFYNYGTLPIYINYVVDIFHYLYLMGQPETAPAYLNSLADIKTSLETKWSWTISHPSFYYWNRLTNVIFGVASVGLTFLIANNVVGNRWAALFAALFFASINPHIEFSALITPDVPAVFFVLAATFLSLRFLDTYETKFLIFSLVCVGCAIATKYNSGLVLLMPVLAVVVVYFKSRQSKSRQSFNARWWLYLLLVPIVTFFVCMPFALLDSASFLSGLGFELRHYKIHGHGPFSSIPGIRHIKFQANQIYGQIGFLGALGAALGLLACVKRPKLLFVLLLPLAHFFYMTTMKVNFHRNFLVIYPFIAVSYAATTWIFWQWLQSLKLKSESASLLRGVMLSSLPMLLVTVMLGHVVLMAHLAMNESKKIRQVVDSRTALINQLNALAPIAPIKIPNELRVHEQDLRKLKYPFQLLPLKEIISGCSGNAKEALVILPDRLEAGYEATEEEKKLAELYPIWIKIIDLAGAKVVLGQSHTSLEKFSVDPKLYVTDYKVLAPLGLGCSEAKN